MAISLAGRARHLVLCALFATVGLCSAGLERTGELPFANFHTQADFQALQTLALDRSIPQIFLKSRIHAYLASKSRAVKSPEPLPAERLDSFEDPLGHYISRAASWEDLCARVSLVLKTADTSLAGSSLPERNAALLMIAKTTATLGYRSGIFQGARVNCLQLLSHAVGKAWALPALRQNARNVPPHVRVMLEHAVEFHAVYARKMGKAFYPDGTDAYRLLAALPTRRPPKKAGDLYRASWMLLQIGQYEEARRVAAMIPPVPGMTSAPATLKKWADQMEADTKKKKR